MEYRSPLESFLGAIGSLPYRQNKLIKQAVYNAAAQFALILCSVATLGLYKIFEPFFKPLMWAVLVGSALHPLKRSLRDRFQSWFEIFEDTNTPAILGLVLLPLNIFNNLSECIGAFLYNRLHVILFMTVLAASLVSIYLFTPVIVGSITWGLIVQIYNSLDFLLTNSSFILISILLIGYIPVVFFFWKPENNIKFHYASVLIWLMFSGWFANLFNHLRMPLFILLQIVFFGGFLYEVFEVYKNINQAGHKITFSELLSIAFQDKTIELDLSGQNEISTIQENQITLKEEKTESENVNPITDSPKSSTLTDAKIEQKIENRISSDTEKEDPWSLELFNSFDTHQNPSYLPKTDTDVLFTNRGIRLVQATDQIHSSPLSRSTPPFKRSFSQPHFTTSHLRKANFSHISRKIKDSSHRLTSSVETYESTFYLYSVIWCCVVMLFWKNIILLPLLPLPILSYVIKHTGIYFGLWNYLNNNFSLFFGKVTFWCSERHDALIPVPIRGLYKSIHRINIVIKNTMKSSIDTVASCLVIIGLIIFLICASVFTIFQIYAEAIMLVQMIGNVINQTVVQNPELSNLLPPTWNDTVDSVLDNAYQYGREGISKAIKSIVNDVDSERTIKLENQVLELWDRIYQSWMTSDDDNKSGPKVTEEAVKNSWDTFINDIQKSSELFNINGMLNFAKQNIGTLMSVLESIWSLAISNMSLILGSLSTCLSILLGGGTAVLNFIVNMAVFLTTLFYLLNSSGNYYKPVELMTNFSPIGKRLGQALEAAINSVFSASLKMAAFYGMWTWFIHNLFNVKIVYLSSAFATILGAIPFLGTYWACVPGILDLWLSQDRWIAALLFAGFQCLPTSVVDTAIYKEIKGGHPYFTGLAIAGGIFCLGVEGALIGPLLLCGLYVVIDLSSNVFKESPTDESLTLDLNQH